MEVKCEVFPVWITADYKNENARNCQCVWEKKKAASLPVGRWLSENRLQRDVLPPNGDLIA